MIITNIKLRLGSPDSAFLGQINSLQKYVLDSSDTCLSNILLQTTFFYHTRVNQLVGQPQPLLSIICAGRFPKRVNDVLPNVVFTLTVFILQTLGNSVTL